MKPHFFSICAVVRNEGPYLLEWISWHLNEGVDHFYIYDNESTDDTALILLPLVLARKVTYRRWPGTQQQVTIYNHCLKEFSKESEWIAFIDADEFLSAAVFSFVEAFKRFLSSQRKLLDIAIGCVAVKWLLFGSNYHDTIRPGLVIERFTGRGERCDKHVKSIVNTDLATSAGRDPHTFYTRGKAIDERGNVLPVEYAVLPTGSADLFRCNHFITKSREEYFERKLSKPDANSGRTYDPQRVEEMFRAHDLGDYFDTSLADKAITVKKEMEKWQKLPPSPAPEQEVKLSKSADN